MSRNVPLGSGEHVVPPGSVDHVVELRPKGAVRLVDLHVQVSGAAQVSFSSTRRDFDATHPIVVRVENHSGEAIIAAAIAEVTPIHTSEMRTEG